MQFYFLTHLLERLNQNNLQGQRKFICSANDFSLASGQGGGQIIDTQILQKWWNIHVLFCAFATFG